MVTHRLCDPFRVRRTVLILACVVALAGCGSSDPRSAAPSKSEIAKAFRGSPPELAAIHAQASRLLDGGKSAFQARLAALRGHPIVVNKWASWCAPCRAEFPLLQQASVKLGRQVAFLGLDAQDNADNARSFLSKYPVTYPSYRDPDLKIAISMKGAPAQALPTTSFYDRRGRLVYSHPGPYSKEADLIADVRRYTK